MTNKKESNFALFFIYTVAKNIDKTMAEKMLYYNAIGADIPKKVWLTFFYADSNNAYSIEGGTTSVDDVYLFFRNIKSQVPNSDLILSKLSVDDKGGLIDIEVTKNANYTFALSNNKYKSVSKADTTESSANGNGSNNGTSNSVDVPQLPDLPGA